MHYDLCIPPPLPYPNPESVILQNMYPFRFAVPGIWAFIFSVDASNSCFTVNVNLLITRWKYVFATSSRKSNSIINCFQLNVSLDLVFCCFFTVVLWWRLFFVLRMVEKVTLVVYYFLPRVRFVHIYMVTELRSIESGIGRATRTRILTRNFCL